MNPLMILYLAVALFYLLLNYLGFFLSIKYHLSKTYSNRLLPRFKKKYIPAAALFIPCKGTNKHFEKNITSLLDIDYPFFNAYFIVETEADPASAVLERLTKDCPHVHIVVAGKSETNGQKNHNLLKGIEASGERDEVYVFLDSDIAFNRNWIRNLVQPLWDGDVVCTTGFRLLNLSKGTLGECVHVFMVTNQWAWLNFVPFHSLWGGSFAIRRDDFEDLEIKESWRDTAVDDIVLMNRIIKAKKRTAIVPLCIAEMDSAISSLKDTHKWFKRQSLFIKYYVRPIWLFGITMNIFISLNMLLFPVLLLAYILHPLPDLKTLCFSTGIFSLLCMFWALLIKENRSNRHSKILWLLKSPFFFVFSSFSGFTALFTNLISWSGIDYYLNFRGIVKKIRRG